MKTLNKTKAILSGILMIGLAVFTSCSKSDDDTEPKQKQTVVYTAGAELGKAVVRKNGEVLYTIANGSASSGAFSVFVSGKDVYAAGSEKGASGNSIAKVWKNGSELYTLTDGSHTATATSIFVSGNDVYTSGFEDHVRYYAMMWKNSTPTTLSLPTTSSVAKGIYVSDGNVYVAAGMNNQAVVYKNAMTLYTLTDEEDVSQANAVFVSDNDVYAVGYENKHAKSVAKVWKNGSVFATLSDGTNEVQANDVYVTGNDVYVVGAEYYDFADGKIVAKIWKNGVATNLSDASDGFYAFSVYVFNNDVYVAGGNSKGTGIVWKNGQILYTTPGMIRSVFVVEE